MTVYVRVTAGNIDHWDRQSAEWTALLPVFEIVSVKKINILTICFPLDMAGHIDGPACT